MRSRGSTLATAVTGLVLLLGSAACGDDAGATSAATEPAQGAPSTASASELDAQEAAGGESPPGGVTLVGPVDQGDTPAAAVTFSTDGGFDTSDAAVSVGDVVSFASGDDRAHAVVVGDLAGATVTTGLVERFRFTEPGTYLVTEDVTGDTMTVTAD